MSDHSHEMMEAALSYARLGWHVFPCWWVEGGRCACGNPECKSPGKHPIGQVVPGGQNNATTDEATIRAWWGRYPKANIAVNLRASGLCAIDVDPRNGGLETVDQVEGRYGKVESDVMQFTGGGGWHAVFQLPADVLALPGKLGPGVDVKANGYIMLEPSTHVSGKRYGWEASGDPRDGIVPSPLPDWLRALASATPQQITAGMAASRLIPPTVAEELREALATVPSDDRDLWVRVGLALRQCGQQGWDLWDEWSRKSVKYDPVDSARVWHTMKPRGEINYETIFHLAEQHGWINPMKRSAAEAPEAPAVAQVPEDEPVEPAPNPAPQVVPCPVGVVNELAQWVSDSSDMVHPLVSQAVALSILSACASRRYLSEHDDPASLYIALLTPATSYALDALELAHTAMQHAGLDQMVRTVRLGSPQQLYSALHKTPALYYVVGDYGDQLRFARRQPSGLLEQTLAQLARVWVSPKTLPLDSWSEVGFKAGREGEGDKPVFMRPTVTVLSVIGGSQVEQALKRSEVSRGAVDSMIFIPAHLADGWTDAPSHCRPKLPEAIHERMRALRGFAPGETKLSAEDLFGSLCCIVPTMRTVRVVGDLQGVQVALAERYRKGGSGVARTLALGARRNLGRICTVLAAAANPDDPVADQAMVDWAAQFVAAMLEATLAVFRDRGGTDDGDGARSSVYKKVEDYVQEQGTRGASKREIVQYVRTFRDLTTDKRDELLARMEADGTLVVQHERGKRGFRYVHHALAGQHPQQSQTSQTSVDTSQTADEARKVLLFRKKSGQS